VGTVYNNPADTVGTGGAKTEATRSIPVIGFIGRVSIDKGVGVLLDAFGRLPAADRPQLLIAGPGTAEDTELISETYASLIESGDVQLAGPMDARTFYSRADIVAVPTQWHEPFGRVAAEALLSEKALLFSQAGGLPEVIGLYGGRATGVADFRSPDAWATAIRRALDDDYDIRIPRRDGPPDPTAEYLVAYRRAIALEGAAAH
jgi:glycosyltransferase involved in cell wall biosynthesis